jgi:hypothetical protein
LVYCRARPPIAAYRDGAIDPEVVNFAAILNHGKPDRALGGGIGGV